MTKAEKALVAALRRDLRWVAQALVETYDCDREGAPEGDPADHHHEDDVIEECFRCWGEELLRRSRRRTP